MPHIPVLLKEVLDVLDVKDGETVVDATFGGGGHTLAILKSANCFVYGVDKDPEALARSSFVKSEYPDNFQFVQDSFSNLGAYFKKNQVDAILFDFGISSFQVDDPERGFSFSKDGPLDMRMSKTGVSAYDVANNFLEEDLADIIYTYGDEHKSRQIASNILKHRKQKKIETTIELRNIINEVFGFDSKRKRFSNVDNSTKTFQAIRIFVNDELHEISKALESLDNIINNNGRIATISFHALEDRIVKKWFKSFKSRFNRKLTQIDDKIVKASIEEIRSNPRSRSAVLRGFIINE